jgi:hypothetical protein
VLCTSLPAVRQGNPADDPGIATSGTWVPAEPSLSTAIWVELTKVRSARGSPAATAGTDGTITSRADAVTVARQAVAIRAHGPPRVAVLGVFRDRIAAAGATALTIVKALKMSTLTIVRPFAVLCHLDPKDAIRGWALRLSS